MKKLIFITVLVLMSCVRAIAEDQVNVLRVVDGDTLSVLFKGVTQNVRLIGIDTPESKNNAKAKLDAKALKKPVEKIVKQGKLASEHMRFLINKNTTILLTYDKTKKDKYGRILAYAYLPNGTMLNRAMIQDGYAYVLTIKPNTKYSEIFKAEYTDAVKKHLGLWK